MTNTAPVEVSQRVAWPEIKRDYLKGTGGLRPLAAEHGVSFHTLAKRARREGWALQRRQLSDAVATSMATTAVQTATEQGREIGLTAARMLERQIRDTEAWLDRIEAVAGPANGCTLEPREIRELVSSWRSVIEAGRSAFRLDEKTEAPNPLAGGLGSIRIEVSAGGQVNVSGGAPGCYLPTTPAARQIAAGPTPAVDVESAKVSPCGSDAQ